MTASGVDGLYKGMFSDCIKKLVIFLSTQDFVINLLAGTKIGIGQQSDPDDGSKHDILLFATDILSRHCYFHRHGAGGPTALCPCPDALVTRNGEVLRKEVQLSPGDVIGLGQCYLFLFKDPLALMHEVRSQSTARTVADCTVQSIPCVSISNLFRRG